jgi:oligoribonuclease NrnB/cAMP/cGMP phosphodiesterase (DHH superfamily)
MVEFGRHLCIYHAGCADGFAAALVVREAYKHLPSNLQVPDCNFVPMQYGQVPEWLTEEAVNAEQRLFQIIYIVDFSFPLQLLAKMAKIARTVRVFDHHKTFKEMLTQASQEGYVFPENLSINFNPDMCGAQIVAEALDVKDIHKVLIDYVGDRDLWKFKLPQSKAVNAVVQNTPRTFEDYRHLSRNVTFNFSQLVAQGDIILGIEKKQLDYLETLARPIEIEAGAGVKHRGLVINAPALFSSELGNRLAQKATFGATYFQDSKGDTVFSLRSVGDFDVSNLAKAYGGGGHKNAAGFKLSNPQGTTFSGVTIWTGA